MKRSSAILFKDTPVEQLQDFERIERSVRDHMLEQVSPQIGNFFTQRHGNQCGSKAAGAELSGSFDAKPKTSPETGLKSESSSESTA